MGKYGNINSGITTTEKRLPIIPLVNNYYARKKNPTDSYSTSLRLETSKMHKNSLPYFQSKYKESSPSSIGDE